MKRTPLAWSLVLVLLAVTAAEAADGPQADLRAAIEFARDKVYPSLVNISVVVRQYSGGRTARASGAGSGVIVSPAGHVLTNYHVAGNTTRILCTLPNRERIEATVVAHDPLTDLSVLKLVLENRKDPTQPLPFATLGDSSVLRVGDSVLAMGNPMSLSSSMTLGIVSNPRRVFTSFTGAEAEELDLGEGQKTGMFTRWIQHDALILPGNSGGPLVNLKGEVVGINELGGRGVGFAIPSNLAAHVLNQALMFGEVRRGWFGFTVVPVHNLDREDGALVSSVWPAGPAEQAGIRPGDVILSLDGDPVVVRFFEEVPPLYKRISDFAPGKKVRVRLNRDGHVEEVTLTAARMEKYLGEEKEIKTWGVTVRDITGPMALIRRYPDDTGVRIKGVRPGMPADAAKPRLRGGDVIRSVAGVPVADLKAFLDLLAKNGKEKELVLVFRRGDQELVTVLKSKTKDRRRGGGELPMAWIGVRTQVLTSDVAKALRLRGKKGFRVTQVYPDTQAQRSGLKVGDVITHINGSALRAFRLQDAQLLRRRIENMDIGDEAELTVLRDGKEMTISVQLEETPTTAHEAKTALDEKLEYGVRDITFMDRIRNRWTRKQRGVVVVSVTGGGWASLGGLRPGDLILTLQDKQIIDVRTFKRAIKRLREEKPKRVKIFVRRGYRTAFIFVEADWTALGDAEPAKNK